MNQPVTEFYDDDDRLVAAGEAVLKHFGTSRNSLEHKIWIEESVKRNGGGQFSKSAADKTEEAAFVAEMKDFQATINLAFKNASATDKRMLKMRMMDWTPAQNKRAKALVDKAGATLRRSNPAMQKRYAEAVRKDKLQREKVRKAMTPTYQSPTPKTSTSQPPTSHQSVR